MLTWLFYLASLEILWLYLFTISQNFIKNACLPWHGNISDVIPQSPPPPPTPWKCDEKSGQGQSVNQVIHSLIFQVIIYF